MAKYLLTHVEGEKAYPGVEEFDGDIHAYMESKALYIRTIPLTSGVNGNYVYADGQKDRFGDSVTLGLLTLCRIRSPPGIFAGLLPRCRSSWRIGGRRGINYRLYVIFIGQYV
ncbi:hypothetical protein V4V36_25090 [Paenibacillus lautus]